MLHFSVLAAADVVALASMNKNKQIIIPDNKMYQF